MQALAFTFMVFGRRPYPERLIFTSFYTEQLYAQYKMLYLVIWPLYFCIQSLLQILASHAFTAVLWRLLMSPTVDFSS